MRAMLKLLTFLALLWIGGLAWFISKLPKEPLSDEVKVEALVVLTGGKGRIEHGLAMLADNVAPVLFISGVESRVTEEKILHDNTTTTVREHIRDTGGEIVIDRIAHSTVSNADQTAAFLRKRNIHRIRLITADYHMLRSVHEFHAAMPELEIIQDPVFPEGFQRENWWKDMNTRHLMLSEFYKYIAVIARDLIRPTKSLSSD